jgi:hypothetical protein
VWGLVRECGEILLCGERCGVLCESVEKYCCVVRGVGFVLVVKFLFPCSDWNVTFLCAERGMVLFCRECAGGCFETAATLATDLSFYRRMLGLPHTAEP